MVKRYHFDEDDRNIFGCRDGEFVDYYDYAALESLNRELVGQVNLLLGTLQDFCGYANTRGKFWTNEDWCVLEVLREVLGEVDYDLLTKLKEAQ